MNKDYFGLTDSLIKAVEEATKPHTVPKTDKEKKLASLAHPKDKITHKDVMVGRGVIAKEEVEEIDEKASEEEKIDMDMQMKDFLKRGGQVKQLKSKIPLKRSGRMIASGSFSGKERSTNPFGGKSYVRNEGVEELDELNKPTLASYAKKASHDARMTGQLSKDFETAGKKYRRPEMKKAAARLSTEYKEKAWKREAGVNKAVDRLAKEEVELDEMDKSQPSSSRGAEGLPLGKRAEPVKTDKVQSDALKILQKQYKKVKEEVELDEATPTAQQVKQAIGIARDKRYAKGNVSGAVKAMDKVNPGLAQHPAVKKELQKQNEETDTPGNSYEHQCAIHVKHAKLGEGVCLTSQHADPDEEDYIEWYDVMFSDSIERVPSSELEIVVSESHMHAKRKKGKM